MTLMVGATSPGKELLGLGQRLQDAGRRTSGDVWGGVGEALNGADDTDGGRQNTVTDDHGRRKQNDCQQQRASALAGPQNCADLHVSVMSAPCRDPPLCPGITCMCWCDWHASLQQSAPCRQGALMAG